MGYRTNTAVWMEKHKRWQLKVQKDGVRRTFYSYKEGRTGQRECNKKVDDWLDDGIQSPNKRVFELYEGYLESLKLRQGRSGWEKEDYFWRVHVEPQIGKLKIKDVTTQRLQDIINKAHAAGRTKKTLTGLLCMIRSFLKYCRSVQATTLFPETLSVPKSARDKGKTVLQPSALVTLMNVNTTLLYGKRKFDDYIFAFRFQVYTGLRPGELRGLRWEDISGRRVFVRRSINKYNETTTGKNENAIRSFYLIDLAYDVLEEYKKYIELENINENDFIFNIPSLSTYEKRWSRYCETNNIPHIEPYEMRHTFVSIAKKLPDGQVKPLVGHSKSMDTFGIYGHELDGEDIETAEELNSLFTKVLGRG